MKLNKRYFLSLPTKEKLKMLDSLLKNDFHSYMIVARYFLDTPIYKGGLSTGLLNQELDKSLKRHYFIKKREQKQ
jgi:hypothetical protein|tara:strand:- start:993 stop:1217 length:225 start_codon:yes stop_codon:yes gene_type:complete